MHNNFPGKADNRELEHFLEDLRHASAVHLHCLMGIFFELRFPEETNRPNDDKNRSGQCGFGKVLGGYYGTSIRDSVSFKRLMTLHKALHTMAEECLEKSARDVLTPAEYSAFLHATQRFQHFIDALNIRTTGVLIEVDELTGVHMRNTMETQLRMEWERAQRMNTTFCIAMVDLDHFKLVNDEYGHIFGDVVLAEIANKLVDSLRPYDKVYRYGGEEFLLLLPDSNLEEAQAVLNRLRTGIAEHEISDGKQTIQLTISIGVTQYAAESDISTLIKQADAALYQAKNTGRNLVVAAT